MRMVEYLSERENWLVAMWLGMGWMVGVPALMALYYHWTVRRIPGGAALRAAQRGASPDMAGAGEMWRRLRGGEFGAEGRRLVTRCIWISVIWAAVLAAWLGTLLYVEAQVKARGGWPEGGGEAGAGQPE
jgi:hypothetical protein